ncbi:insulin-like growth factor-binding protein 6 [Tachyglossus aculeatus]|uniref:insulin-like growth factor-binding protein 6 n=1 Tax=Tachyglossus aculeatus TaxID=9261 RepID=UPI0018F3F46F|nr:insulin-like growth factor-binding protein 6 [Tachyglossus aculeatus]
MPPPWVLLLPLALAAPLAPLAPLSPRPACGQGAPPPSGGCRPGDEAGDGGGPRRLGQPCGVYTASCGPGLQCRPPPRDGAPLRALLLGRGRCQPGDRGAPAPPPEGPDPTGPQDEGGERAREAAPAGEGAGAGTAGDKDPEMGPCRRHLDAVLRRLQAAVFRGGDLYIPNCDHRGHYRRRQCKSSTGQRRGPCWCVDRKGQPVPSPAGPDSPSVCPPGPSS